MHRHDAVIVGAGPGGAATAFFLATSAPGIDVLLLDRATFPRDKTCGDGLTPRALRVLDQMCLLDEVRRQGCTVSGYQVVAPNGRSTTASITSAPGALVVPRWTLDQLILQRALDSGARLQSGVTVHHVEPTPEGVRVHAAGGQTIDARVAVIATGAALGVLTRSAILRQPPRTMLAARAYFEHLQHEVARTFQLRFDRVPQPGYGWIFPLSSDAANIGVGFHPNRRSGTTAQAFDRFIAGPNVRPLVASGRQAGPVKGYPIRVDFLRAPTSATHTLLVGEAAGLVNPLTGEGIDYALESGHIAADFLSRRLAADAALDLRAYDAQLHQRFDRIFRFSEWMRDWYCKPLLLNALVPLANHRPELRQLLANIVLGEREPRGYGPLTMLARLLTYLATTTPRASER